MSAEPQTPVNTAASGKTEVRHSLHEPDGPALPPDWMDTRVSVSMWLLAPRVSRRAMGMMSGTDTAPAAMVTSIYQTSQQVFNLGAVTMVTAAASCWSSSCCEFTGRTVPGQSRGLIRDVTDSRVSGRTWPKMMRGLTTSERLVCHHGNRSDARPLTRMRRVARLSRRQEPLITGSELVAGP